jgi:hypothetical protein
MAKALGIDWDKVVILGILPDRTIARQLKCSPNSVKYARRKRGIPLPLSSEERRGKAKTLGIKWDDIEDFGQVPDTVIARRIGVSSGAVCKARRARNIPAYAVYLPDNKGLKEVTPKCLHCDKRFKAQREEHKFCTIKCANSFYGCLRRAGYKLSDIEHPIILDLILQLQNKLVRGRYRIWRNNLAELFETPSKQLSFKYDVTIQCINVMRRYYRKNHPQEVAHFVTSSSKQFSWKMHLNDLLDLPVSELALKYNVDKTTIHAARNYYRRKQKNTNAAQQSQ